MRYTEIVIWLQHILLKVYFYLKKISSKWSGYLSLGNNLEKSNFRAYYLILDDILEKQIFAQIIIIIFEKVNQKYGFEQCFRSVRFLINSDAYIQSNKIGSEINVYIAKINLTFV